MSRLQAVLSQVDQLLGVGRGTRVSPDSYTSELLEAWAERQGRSVNDWVWAPIRSANENVRANHKKLKAASRELVTSTWFASEFLGLLSDNVIGHEGIRLQARNMKEPGKPWTEINNRIESAWLDWGDQTSASADKVLAFPEIETLSIETIPTDGEVLIRLLPGFDNKFGFAVQVLDTDQLSVKLNRPASAGKNEIRMGIEIDSWGAPVAYWIADTQPGDPVSGSKAIQRIPAAQIIHTFARKRAGQARGLAWFGPILTSSQHLHGYTEAELVAARTAAAKMGFFTIDPEYYPDPDSSAGRAKKLTMDATPGSLESLPAGYSFESWDPTHPSGEFTAFTKAILRSISGGLRVSYNTLANDLEGVNYSSLRQGALTERDVYRRVQAWHSRHVEQRVFQAWLPQAILSGQLKLPTHNADDWRAHTWRPRGWGWVDPLKEVNADVTAVENGLKSRTEVVAARGRDLEDVLLELQEEEALAEFYGITFSADPKQETKENEKDDGSNPADA